MTQRRRTGEAVPKDPVLDAWDRQLAETGQVVFGRQPFKVAILLLGLVAVVLIVCPGVPIVVRLVGGMWLIVFGSIAVPLQYQILTAPGPPLTATDAGLHFSLIGKSRSQCPGPTSSEQSSTGLVEVAGSGSGCRLLQSSGSPVLGT